MTIVRNDSAGNYYIGDSRWSNHNSTYPSVYHLLSQPLTGSAALLTTLASTCGFSSFSGIPANFVTPFNYTIIDFTPQGDTAITSNKRFNVKHNHIGGLISLAMRNDTGTVIMSSNVPSYSTPFNSSYTNPLESGTQISICADSKSISIFLYKCVFNTGAIESSFNHIGELKNVNGGGGVYSSNVMSRSVSIVSNTGSITDQRRNYFLGNVTKTMLEEGRAEYPINCSDNTIPNSNWATDFVVFDNNPPLGNPGMGVVRNMLLSTAIGLTVGKPVYVDGSAVSDGGSRWFMPVGTHAGKTMLMRCYSSVVVS